MAEITQVDNLTFTVVLSATERDAFTRLDRPVDRAIQLLAIDATVNYALCSRLESSYAQIKSGIMDGTIRPEDALAAVVPVADTVTAIRQAQAQTAQDQAQTPTPTTSSTRTK